MEQSNNKNPGQESGQEGGGEAHKPVAGDPAGAPGGAETPARGGERAAANAASDAMKNLPVVEAPSLDAAKADESAVESADAPAPSHAAAPIPIAGEAAEEFPDDAAVIEFAAAPQPRSFRFALLAATIAVAAGLGSFVGALAASGYARHDVADAAGARSTDAHTMLQAVNKQLAELNALKASLDTANRNAGAQFGKIADRLTTLEHAQAEPAAKLARLADAVDRLDRRAAAAPEITGSIAKPAAAPAPAAEHVLNDWILRDVHNGRALVENRHGAVFVVAAGGNLPGIGHVDGLRRQDGNWIVVTARGLITSDR